MFWPKTPSPHNFHFFYCHVVWLFGWVNNKHEIETVPFSMSLTAFYDMNGGQTNQMEKIIQK
jgi:hypothetical protein